VQLSTWQFGITFGGGISFWLTVSKSMILWWVWKCSNQTSVTLALASLSWIDPMQVVYRLIMKFFWTDWVFWATFCYWNSNSTNCRDSEMI